MKVRRPTHGIVNPALGFEHFRLARYEPSADLAPFAERYWIVRWDLRDREPYDSQILPHPSVHLSFSADRAEVHGVGTRLFVRRLVGAGHVFGVKFTPAGFRPFIEASVATLTDRVLSPDEAFGVSCGELTRSVANEDDDLATRALVEAFLRRRGPTASAETALANRLVEAARVDRELARAEDLAIVGGLGLRAMQRMFREHVGVGPKWVIRRFRIHDAAERCRDGATLDWAALAQELGYFDQAHFSRDFKAQLGRSPTDYARACREAATTRGDADT